MNFRHLWILEKLDPINHLILLLFSMIYLFPDMLLNVFLNLWNTIFNFSFPFANLFLKEQLCERISEEH